MKSFLCIIDNVIRFMRVRYSVLWNIKFIIDFFLILTVVCRQIFKSIQNKARKWQSEQSGWRQFD